MADVIFVAVIVAFFGVAWALVKACDRIIGPDVVSVGDVGSGGTDAPSPVTGPMAADSTSASTGALAS